MAKNINGNLAVDGNLSIGNELTALEAQAIWANAQPVSDDMASYSWAEIKSIFEAGRAPQSWLGKTKTDLGTDGTTRTFRVCDMQGLYGKHGVLEQVELEATTYQWNPTQNKDSDNCYNNYSISDMRTTHLPAILLKYSSDLQAVITNTTYKVAKSGMDRNNILELTDKLFLPAEKEIFGARQFGSQTEADALTQFQWYVGKSDSDRKKYQSETVLSWWFRTASAGDTGVVCGVGKYGTEDTIFAYNNSIVGTAPIFAF